MRIIKFVWYKECHTAREDTQIKDGQTDGQQTYREVKTEWPIQDHVWRYPLPSDCDQWLSNSEGNERNPINSRLDEIELMSTYRLVCEAPVSRSLSRLRIPPVHFVANRVHLGQTDTLTWQLSVRNAEY